MLTKCITSDDNVVPNSAADDYLTKYITSDDAVEVQGCRFLETDQVRGPDEAEWKLSQR